MLIYIAEATFGLLIIDIIMSFVKRIRSSGGSRPDLLRKQDGTVHYS